MSRSKYGIILLAIAGVAGMLETTVLAQKKSPESVAVTLCDGTTEMTVPGLKPGEKLDRAKAQEVAQMFLSEWQRRNPGNQFLLAQNQAKPAEAVPPAPMHPPPPAKVAKPVKPSVGGQQNEIYNRFSERDKLVWKMETDKFVAEGNRVFHDADAFGGTIGVSCDMCHPNASNTHPETYPKYQVQLQRVALLRDMINWCIQNPTKGKPLADDDPRLRAMEAYILAQRNGKVIETGKH